MLKPIQYLQPICADSRTKFRLKNSHSSCGWSGYIWLSSAKRGNCRMSCSLVLEPKHTRTPSASVFFLGGYLKKLTEAHQNNPIFPGHPCNSTAKLCEIFTMQNVPPKVPNFVPSEWAQHLGTRVAFLRIDHAEIYRFLEMRVRLENVYHHYHHSWPLT